jgi:dTDP-4-dehydrorhamnose reductase
VLLTGAGGQLGREFGRARPEAVELVSMDGSDLDITRSDDVAAALADVSPRVVVNAAAFTAVDRAEDEPQRAYAVNAEGVAHLAESVRANRARLVHVSTDFVFDGMSERPYRPIDEPRPLSVYGRSKLAGEESASKILGDQASVVRTSWLYTSQGRNFVTTMLRLMAEKDELAVVDDQVGSPTWAALLAEALWGVALRRDMPGVWHWTDGGNCTWFEFARAIQEEATTRGLLARSTRIRPVATAEFPARAVRPAYSVLDSSATRTTLSLEAVPWRLALGRMLDEMVKADG